MGQPFDPDQTRRVETFRNWLIEEAIPGGGIGPNEAERIDTRHLADSVLFARYLGFPDLVWDLGSGVGLPGIPLAILLPATRFVLVDRSKRRVDLLERAVRMIGIDNVEARCADIRDLQGPVSRIVSRASLPPERLGPMVTTLLGDGGVAVVGGSWRCRPQVGGWHTEEVHSDALDRTIWFLIMRRQ